MGRMVKIGLIQVEQREEDNYDKRLDILEDMARRCYEEGAELVFFPEAYQHVPDRSILRRPAELRETYRSWKERCGAIAREYRAYLVPWDYEITEDGRIYNSSYILDRNGDEAGRFHKVNLTRSELVMGLSHGEDFPVFDLDFGRVGIMICFDNYFPESARILGNRGAELILYPLYGDTMLPQWEIRLRARAIDNCLHIATCQIDRRPEIAYSGLVSPSGEVLHRLSSYPSHLVVEADLARKVVTNTMAVPGQRENLREYLKKCRFQKAYQGILEEAADIRSWEEIYEGSLPAEISETGQSSREVIK